MAEENTEEVIEFEESKAEEAKEEEVEVEAPKEEPKEEAPAPVEVPKPDLSAKAEIIRNSKMPEWQKEEYLKKLGFVKEKKEKLVPFGVYAKIKKIPPHLHRAILIQPKAKGLKLASMEQWDEVYKSF